MHSTLNQAELIICSRLNTSSFIVAASSEAYQDASRHTYTEKHPESPILSMRTRARRENRGYRRSWPMPSEITRNNVKQRVTATTKKKNRNRHPKHPPNQRIWIRSRHQTPNNKNDKKKVTKEENEKKILKKKERKRKKERIGVGPGVGPSPAANRAHLTATSNYQISGRKASQMPRITKNLPWIEQRELQDDYKSSRNLLGSSRASKSHRASSSILANSRSAVNHSMLAVISNQGFSGILGDSQRFSGILWCNQDPALLATLKETEPKIAPGTSISISIETDPSYPHWTRCNPKSKHFNHPPSFA